MITKKILLFIFILSVFTLKAQEKEVSDKEKQEEKAPNPNRFKAIVLPSPFYTPDTKWGGGAVGLMTFNFPKDSLNARRSSVTIGIAYTQLKQFLLYFPFQLFPKNQKYWISGEVGYFKYVFNYFGTGNNIRQEFIDKYDSLYVEKYDARFPRVRLNVSKKISSGLYVGLRYAFDDFEFTRRDPEGLLVENKVIGANGGRVSGGGLVVNYDSRNSLFYPTKGWLVEGQLYTEGAYTGSDFSYQKLTIDASRYYEIGKNGVLAINGVLSLASSGIPFHQMPVIGGTKKMRGYFEGTYRDANLLMLQGEYRFPLFWRFGGVVFGGIGEVSNKAYQWNLSNIRYNLGTGVRFTLDKAQRINLRADFGIGYKSSGFYLTIGEAF
jgi:outer membrane protein assembly factor BamA